MLRKQHVLLLLSPGLGLHQIVSLYIQSQIMSSKHGNVIFLLNFTEQDIECLNHILHQIQTPMIIDIKPDNTNTKNSKNIKSDNIGNANDTIDFINYKTLTQIRQQKYISGGVFATTSQLLLVDLLCSTLSPSIVTHVLVNKCEQETDRNGRVALILTILQQQSKYNNFKTIAICENAGKLVQNLNTVMQALYINDVLMWPAFRLEVKTELRLDHYPTVECYVKLGNRLSKLQKTIIDIISIIMQEINRLFLKQNHNQQIFQNMNENTNTMCINEAVFTALDRLSKEKRRLFQNLSKNVLMAELLAFKSLLQSILISDCVYLYFWLLVPMRDQADQIDSVWGALNDSVLQQKLHELMEGAKSRVYTMKRIKPEGETQQVSFQESTSISEAIHAKFMHKQAVQRMQAAKADKVKLQSQQQLQIKKTPVAQYLNPFQRKKMMVNQAIQNKILPELENQTQIQPDLENKIQCEIIENVENIEKPQNRDIIDSNPKIETLEIQIDQNQNSQQYNAESIENCNENNQRTILQNIIKFEVSNVLNLKLEVNAKHKDLAKIINEIVNENKIQANQEPKQQLIWVHTKYSRNVKKVHCFLNSTYCRKDSHRFNMTHMFCVSLNGQNCRQQRHQTIANIIVDNMNANNQKLKDRIINIAGNSAENIKNTEQVLLEQAFQETDLLCKEVFRRQYQIDYNGKDQDINGNVSSNTQKIKFEETGENAYENEKKEQKDQTQTQNESPYVDFGGEIINEDAYDTFGQLVEFNCEAVFPQFRMTINSLSSTAARQAFLQQEQPSYIILLEPDEEMVRLILVQRNLTSKNAIDGQVSLKKVYYLMFEDSLESWEYESGYNLQVQAFQKIAQMLSENIVQQFDPNERIKIIDQQIQGQQHHGLVSMYIDPRLMTRSKPVVIVDKREFRCSLPIRLYYEGYHVMPMFLKYGDYILTPDTIVERKAIQTGDLLMSLQGQRLLEQIQKLITPSHGDYKFTNIILLIEFASNDLLKFDFKQMCGAWDGPEGSQSMEGEVKRMARQIIMNKQNGGTVAQQENYVTKARRFLINSLTRLAVMHPNIQILWAKNVDHAVALFEMLKKGKLEPNPVKVISERQDILEKKRTSKQEQDQLNKPLKQSNLPRSFFQNNGNNV